MRISIAFCVLLLTGCAMTPKEAMLATEEQLCTTFFQPLHPNHTNPTVYGEIVRRQAYCVNHAFAYMQQRNVQMQQSLQMMGLGASVLQNTQPQVQYQQQPKICQNTWNGMSWVQVCF